MFGGVGGMGGNGDPMPGHPSMPPEPPRHRRTLDLYPDLHANLYAPLPELNAFDDDEEEVTQIWRPDRVRPRRQVTRVPVSRPDRTRRGGRVIIANRADGGILYWVGKLYGFTALVVLAALGITGFSLYASAASRTPAIPDLARYAQVVPAVSRIYAGDGTLLGEFAVEWREVVPYDRIPPKLVEAFLAAEDHEFFDHHGIYFKGIMRAAWRNLVAGDFEQGGSTITQQVAKQFLSAEKSLLRKAKEAIFAAGSSARTRSARSWPSTSTTSTSATAPTGCRRPRGATSPRSWRSSTSARWRPSPAWPRRRPTTRRSLTPSEPASGATRSSRR